MNLLTPDALLSHWMGHRRLSRRTLELCPDDQLFSFGIGGMCLFGKLALGMLGSNIEPLAFWER
jgi:hypothetical protein